MWAGRFGAGHPPTTLFPTCIQPPSAPSAHRPSSPSQLPAAPRPARDPAGVPLPTTEGGAFSSAFPASAASLAFSVGSGSLLAWTSRGFGDAFVAKARRAAFILSSRFALQPGSACAQWGDWICGSIRRRRRTAPCSGRSSSEGRGRTRPSVWPWRARPPPRGRRTSQGDSAPPANRGFSSGYVATARCPSLAVLAAHAPLAHARALRALHSRSACRRYVPLLRKGCV